MIWEILVGMVLGAVFLVTGITLGVVLVTADFKKEN